MGPRIISGDEFASGATFLPVLPLLRPKSSYCMLVWGAQAKVVDIRSSSKTLSLRLVSKTTTLADHATVGMVWSTLVLAEDETLGSGPPRHLGGKRC